MRDGAKNDIYHNILKMYWAGYVLMDQALHGGGMRSAITKYSRGLHLPFYLMKSYSLKGQTMHVRTPRGHSLKLNKQHAQLDVRKHFYILRVVDECNKRSHMQEAGHPISIHITILQERTTKAYCDVHGTWTNPANVTWAETMEAVYFYNPRVAVLIAL